MKPITYLFLVAALSASGYASAHPEGPHDMKNMDMKPCMDMMAASGMDMKGADMGKSAHGKAQKVMTHQASAKVKSVDQASGKVVLEHGPVQTLNWPAMTMGFAVKDPAVLSKLAANKKVDVEFIKEGSAYVVTAVK